MITDPLALSLAHGLTLDGESVELLLAGAPVAMSISGGKDSDDLAIRFSGYLDAIGHPRSRRVLIHSDLGRIEWAASGPQCERLAAFLSTELVVVRRQSGDMIDRWESRWAANVARYTALECVKVILPWSTPSMRFCTSELKTAIITRALRQRWPGERIVSATGIRREESASRALTPITKREKKLEDAKGTTGLTLNPIADRTKADVFALHESSGFPLHEAYTEFGASRVSCCACIMSSENDLRAAARDTRNHAALRLVIRLEITSAFSFQSARWLSDVLDELLTDADREQRERAKSIAAAREASESLIPDDMLYVKGWPTRVPTLEEAELLAGVRRDVGRLQGFTMQYVDAPAIVERYRELMAANAGGHGADDPKGPVDIFLGP